MPNVHKRIARNIDPLVYHIREHFCMPTIHSQTDAFRRKRSLRQNQYVRSERTASDRNEIILT